MNDHKKSWYLQIGIDILYNCDAVSVQKHKIPPLESGSARPF